MTHGKARPSFGTFEQLLQDELDELSKELKNKNLPDDEAARYEDYMGWISAELLVVQRLLWYYGPDPEVAQAYRYDVSFRACREVSPARSHIETLYQAFGL